MGFPVADILSEEAHYSEYICPICCNLVDYAHTSYTSCSHVFCSSCLKAWLHSNTRCPSCNFDITRNQQDIQPLQTASGLAWRVLGRIKCRCPLHDQACPWTGEYSEVDSHLLNSDSHKDADTLARSRAEGLKEQGNQRFEARDFSQAIALYSKGIELDPTLPSLYTNRAAAYLQIFRADLALADALTAVRIAPSFDKAHVRAARALCELGRFEDAVNHLSGVVGALPSLKQEMTKCTTLLQLHQRGHAAMGEGRYADARECFGSILTMATPLSTTLDLARAELGLGLCDRALRTCRDVIKRDGSIPSAYAVRGFALFLSNDMDQAMTHFREALRLDPDNSEASKLFLRCKKAATALSAAATAASTRDFQQAYSYYSDAIELSQAPLRSPLFAFILSHRAEACLRLERYEEAIQDSSRALEAREDCVDALVVQGNAMLALGRNEQVKRTMQSLMEVHQSDSRIRKLYERAEFEIRKLARPNYYAILDVPRVASEMEIKVAYKKRAMECHPDKFATKSDEERSKAEAEFKLLGEALEVLTDPMQRDLYDRGFDKAAIRERVERANKEAARGGGYS
eukprot:c13300_g1_i1.p1 GENE.c13300_g1_i1~~c13300_g1_i1.p1  ORF type:complete len:574 (-),score=88.74 c13300_g1_i1:7-1728(-)